MLYFDLIILNNHKINTLYYCELDAYSNYTAFMGILMLRLFALRNL